MTRNIYTVQDMGKAGPYSHAVEANGFVFLSGVVPMNYETGQLETSSIEAATHQVFRNIQRILHACGAELAQVVKATVFLTDMAHFQAMNSVYVTYFPTDPPARSCVAVRELPLGAQVEIEVTVARPAQPQ
jgi:2-iminobutanoate/2-iminopropanoate deaminase